jgi:predicted lactoylglutathione lyase
MAKLIFVNLPVSDLARATAFYEAIGAFKNAQFSDDTASCMVFSETIHAMLMTHDKYRQFSTRSGLFITSWSGPTWHAVHKHNCSRAAETSNFEQ